MAKTDNDFSDIDASAVENQLREPNWLEDKEVVAFDTETSAGDIFMISISGPGYSFVVENDGNTLSPKKIFDTLTRKRFRGNCNVFFNLKFDASVIMKVLPLENCQELRIKGQTEWKKYEIQYIPGKFLEISDSNGHKYEYFDVAQIFGDNLSGAIESWLDKGAKNTQDIDTDKFDSKQYIKNNYKQIKKYALSDARLTRQITQKLFQEAEENQNIPIGRPYSTGYLASQYLTQRLSHKIGYGPEKMQRMAWESYSGGRFEVFQRGQIGEVVGADINSAYPDKLNDLPDPASLNWFGTHSKDIGLSDIRNADYGFLRLTVTTNPAKRIQPFATKINGTQTYPIMKEIDITVIKDIFLYALNNDYILDYDIQEAILGNENENTRKPFDFMEDKYNERKKLEDKDNDNAANTIKIYLNSIYGKTLQTVWDITDYDIEIDIDKVSDGDNIQIDRRSGVAYKQKLRAGTWFNPFIGTYTTGLTRLQLHKTVEELDLIDNTILFATDCIMLDKSAYENSNFDSLMVSASDTYREQLGKWDKEYEGNAFVVGSGVYQVDMKDGKQKTVTRGFGSLEEKDLRKQARRSENGHINTGNKRPIGFAEALHGKNLTVEDIGRFDKATKKLYADFDEGRKWEREEIDFSNLLESSENSGAVVYE